MTKTDLRELLKPYIEQLKMLYGDKLHSVVLYGSYARGDETPDSDIDIMIFVNMTEEELSVYEDQLSDLTYDFNMEYETDIEPVEKSVSFFDYWADVYPFYKNVKKDGISLYAA